jgi:hypothetical protein
MTEYAHARVALDPLGTIYLQDGSRLLQMELVLTEDPDHEPPALGDPVCALDSTSARELAHTLLQLADHADRNRRPQADRQSGRSR